MPIILLIQHRLATALIYNVRWSKEYFTNIKQMGCDFYTYYKLCIEYKNGDQVNVKEYVFEETKERHYFWEDLEWDNDFEERNDYYERCHIYRNEQIKQELLRYTNEHLYKHNKWLCVFDAKDKYSQLLKKFGIKEESVIQIWKQGDAHLR